MEEQYTITSLSWDKKVGICHKYMADRKEKIDEKNKLSLWDSIVVGFKMFLWRNGLRKLKCDLKTVESNSPDVELSEIIETEEGNFKLISRGGKFVKTFIVDIN